MLRLSPSQQPRRSITYDFDSIEDHAVTIRERDTMEQVRIPLDKVKSYLIERLGC